MSMLSPGGIDRNKIIITTQHNYLIKEKKGKREEKEIKD